MSELIAGLARLIVRLVLVVAALVFAAAVVAALFILLSIWLLRSSWARLTGQPVTPFVMRVTPRSGFEQVFRGRHAAQAEGAALRPDRAERAERPEIADITDVEPKEPR
jgi:hypothetical protein